MGRYLLAVTSTAILLAGCQNTGNLKPQDNDPEALTASKTEQVVAGSADSNQPVTPVLNSPRNVDLWTLTREGMQLDLDADQPRIATQFKWYASHPQYMQRVGQRSSRYYHYILNRIKERGLPTELALLPVVESAYDPFAYSSGRASGPWQFIPSTAKYFGIKSNWWYDGRRDIITSTEKALNYLEQLNKRFDGDWLLALAAYNAGGGTVSKAMRKNREAGLPTDYWSLKLPRETMAYVPKLLAVSKLVRDAEQHQLVLPTLNNQPYFEIIDIGSQIDLAQAAKMANISTQELYQLNPGFNRWATDPSGPHRLLIPVKNAEQFRQQLAQIPPESRVSWSRYTIKRGDSLSTIAARHNITTSVLRSTNKLASNNIRAGRTLLIPTAQQDSGQYALSASQRLSRKENQLAQSNREKRHYKVNSGDSLWSIARSYNVSPQQIAGWNQMSTKTPLQIGQQLVIWKQPKSATTLSKRDQQLTRRIGYQVRNGDSLYGIANKFSVTINDIKRWNNLENQKYIKPGQQLTLYIDISKSR
ncbi:lytic transglycosylase [Aliamphritea spongicola]|uniref:lytic transglycosylase n=1 Tax=Aliamphritea spongicola TaxID=707589 RepID=UPI00196BA25D|nr:LysM peptidoglycan-binding domain-containing protein [Aliamphritea spongicola]MBN3560583.1 LysM peptidoglycan-binding domain-containing protein [Aliamphritea spongicola]